MYETNAPTPLPIVPADILERFHVNEPYDTRFASGARLLQSIWRERRGLPVGKIKPEKGRRRPLGSRLTPEVARTGVNFLTPEIAKLARRESVYREYGAFIEEERLWGNLLSSQPLSLQSLWAREARPLARYEAVPHAPPGLRRGARDHPFRDLARARRRALDRRQHGVRCPRHCHHAPWHAQAWSASKSSSSSRSSTGRAQ